MLLRCAFLFFVWIVNASADCIDMPDHLVDVPVKSCAVLDPDEVMKGSNEEFPELRKFYTGALVTDQNGQSYVYPSSEANPCQEFAADKNVTKMVSTVCCDSGAWGKCVLGGRFLYDPGGKAPNTFQ